MYVVLCFFFDFSKTERILVLHKRKHILKQIFLKGFGPQSVIHSDLAKLMPSTQC